MLVFSVWHYDEWHTDLFIEYVKLFLKLKVEASGFPANVNTQEEKEIWAKKWYDEEGILIDIEKVEHNPGLRHIAKIALNSLVCSFFFYYCFNIVVILFF
jgi:hypothetical protein